MEEGSIDIKLPLHLGTEEVSRLYEPDFYDFPASSCRGVVLPAYVVRIAPTCSSPPPSLFQPLALVRSFEL